ncbi:MAG: DUF2203 domain-containing protein [Vulcanimicrobiaceae bacterium]
MFSPERVNALIPALETLIHELWSRRTALAILVLERDPALRRAGASPASEAERRSTRRAGELKAEIVRLVERIESHGCIVKDLDLGLLDFPALRGGVPSFLCWKAGEPAVAHWHGTDETFVDRKPI